MSILYRPFVLAGCLFLAGAALLYSADSPEVKQAQDAATHGEWEQVVQILTPYVQTNRDIAAFTLLAGADMEMGDTLAAVQNYEHALNIDSRHPQALLPLTDHYLRANKVAEADRIVKAAEEKDKKGKLDEIKVARGRIYAAQGNMAEATKALASATGKNPKNPLYPQILARIYADQKVWQLAADNYAKAWALAPGDAALGFEYALALQELKLYNEALDLFKVVQEKDPNNKTVDYMIGRLYYSSKKWGEAATQFKKSAEKRPDHFLSWFLLGRSYIEFSKAEKKNFYGAAEDALRHAESLKPERGDVRNLLAESLLNKGKMMFAIALADTVNRDAAKYDSTLMVLREALAYDSTMSGIRGQMARSFDKKSQLDSAFVYSRAEYLRDTTDRNEFARMVNILQRQQKHELITETLEPRMSDSASFDKYGLILVNSYIETKQWDKAKSLAEQVVARAPDNCDAHQIRAYIFLKREQFAQAISPLLEGVRHCPSDKDLWVTLGDCYYFSDSKDKAQVTKALEAYKRAGSLGSSDGREKAGQVEQILKQLK